MVNSQAKLKEINAQGRAYDFIKESILSLSFRALAHLSAENIAASLGISRTPVREALSRLEQDGLVVKGEMNGFYVRPITLKEIIDTYKVREALEVAAGLEALPYIDGSIMKRLEILIEKSATLLDPQKYAEFVSVNRLFHAEIIGATKNSMLEKIMDPIHDRVRLVGATLILKHAPRQQEVYEENKFILEAFKSKDPVMVKFAIENHIKKAKEHIMKLAKDDAEKIILGPF